MENIAAKRVNSSQAICMDKNLMHTFATFFHGFGQLMSGDSIEVANQLQMHVLTIIMRGNFKIFRHNIPFLCE